MEGAQPVTPVLQLQDVAVSRGRRTLFSDVTFTIGRGELVALMGASGSGKTTMLRAIAGLDPFDRGTIVLDDLKLDAGAIDTRSTLRQTCRKVGMVFQFHYLFEHLSALHNVSLAPIHAHGVARGAAESRGLELLKTLGVEHRATAFPRELSGGEAQRVAIARALAVNPPLLLMDEPTASLDPPRRAELGALLRRLTSESRTLLMATHDEDFAREWATRVLRLRDGRV
jgi:ABC-type polar amino acid transport system ATPase subunit